MQGALELMGIPYTGSGVMASAIAIDKVTTKRIWLSERHSDTALPVAAPRAHSTASRSLRCPTTLGLPVIVKPAREGSSIGVTKVMGYSGMADAVDAAQASWTPTSCASSALKAMK